MSALLLSLPHVTRLAKVLVQVLELDVADQKILEESGMGARGVTSECRSTVTVEFFFSLSAAMCMFIRQKIFDLSSPPVALWQQGHGARCTLSVCART